MKEPIQIRVDEEELLAWRWAAAEEGETLSSWIRGCCNGDVAAMKEYKAVGKKLIRSRPEKLRLEGYLQTVGEDVKLV